MGFDRDMQDYYDNRSSQLANRPSSAPAKKEKLTLENTEVFGRIAKCIDKDSLDDAQDVLTSNNMPKATNRLDLAIKLFKLAKRKDITPHIIKLHPDKDLFEEYYEGIITQKVEEKVIEKLADKLSAKDAELKEQLKSEIEKARKDEHDKVADLVDGLMTLQKKHEESESKRELEEKIKAKSENAEGKSGCGCSGDDGSRSQVKYLYAEATPKSNHMEYVIPAVTIITVAAILAYTFKK